MVPSFTGTSDVSPGEPLPFDPESTDESTDEFALEDELSLESPSLMKRLRELRHLILIVFLLLLMDVLALLWVGRWVDDRNATSYLRGILPNWERSLSQFERCVVGDAATSINWGERILARMSSDRDFRGTVVEVCYPKYRADMVRLRPPGDQPPLATFQEWYVTYDGFGEGVFVDMVAAEATHLCDDLVRSREWYDSVLSSVPGAVVTPRHVQCGIEGVVRDDIRRVQMPTVESKHETIWGEVRVPIERTPPFERDGYLYADFQEARDSNVRVLVRTRDGMGWEEVPYTSAFQLGPLWTSDVVWGVLPSNGDSRSSVVVFERGEWVPRAKLPEYFLPEKQGGGSNLLTIVGRYRAAVGDRLAVISSVDGGYAFSEPTYIMNCSGATACAPALHLGPEGSLAAVNVEQIGYQLNVETSYLSGVGAQVRHQTKALSDVTLTPGELQIDSCFDNTNLWTLVNGEVLLGSNSGGRRWQTVDRFLKAESFGEVALDCGHDWLAIAGVRRGEQLPGRIQYTVCGWSKRCFEPTRVSDHRVSGFAPQLGPLGLTLLFELDPLNNVVVFQDNGLNGSSKLVGFLNSTPIDTMREVRAWRADNQWFVGWTGKR
jgi:hypothetical protein